MVGVAVFVRSYLYVIERGVRIVEQAAHHRHIFLLQAKILVGTAPVGFALIPQHSLETEWDERIDLAVEQGAWCLMLLIWQLAAVKEGKVELAGEAAADRFPVDPGFYGGAAPVGDEQAYRNTEDLLQLEGEEICRGACGCYCFRGILRPGTLAFIDGGQACVTLDCTHADREARLSGQYQVTGALHRLAAEAFHGHFHIGLSRAEPDFSDEDVPQDDFLAVGDGYGVGAAGGRSLYACRPFAVGIGNGDRLF